MRKRVKETEQKKQQEKKKNFFSTLPKVSAFIFIFVFAIVIFAVLRSFSEKKVEIKVETSIATDTTVIQGTTNASNTEEIELLDSSTTTNESNEIETVKTPVEIVEPVISNNKQINDDAKATEQVEKNSNEENKEETKKVLEIKSEEKEEQNSIKFDKSDLYYCTSFRASIFEDATTTSKVIDEVRIGTYLKKLEEKDSMIKVQYNFSDPKEGWVKSSQVTPLSSYLGKDYDEITFEPFEKIQPKVKNVRGIYLTQLSVNTPEKIQNWINFAKRTNLNAFVIDVKGDDGFLLFDIPEVSNYSPEARENAIYSFEKMKELVQHMKNNGIFLIARIVVFKDPAYAKAHPERAIVYKDTGELYYGKYKVPWASAYDRELWKYNVLVSKKAVEVGFDEIQYDYVRFPELTKEQQARVNLRKVTDESFAEAIHKFVKYAKNELKGYNVLLAADVFGLVPTAIDDVGIGQYWEAISNVVDVICPMIYPSHYANGFFGLTVPDAYPYETIYKATKDVFWRNNNIPTPAIYRPWIQSFTATWVPGHITYGEAEIKKQIKALKDLGVNSYMLWNASNRYIEMRYE